MKKRLIALLTTFALALALLPAAALCGMGAVVYRKKRKSA